MALPSTSAKREPPPPPPPFIEGYRRWANRPESGLSVGPGDHPSTFRVHRRPMSRKTVLRSQGFSCVNRCPLSTRRSRSPFFASSMVMAVVMGWGGERRKGRCSCSLSLAARLDQLAARAWQPCGTGKKKRKKKKLEHSRQIHRTDSSLTKLARPQPLPFAAQHVRFVRWQ